MVWTIEAKVLPIVAGGAGHLYFEIWNDAGNRVHQIHGLATNPNGGIKTIGTTADFIKVYTYGSSGYYHPNTTQQTQPDEGHVVYQGSQADVQNALKDIYAAQLFINGQKLPYSPVPKLTLGFGKDYYNSNSVFNTLLNVFDRTLTINSADKEEAKSIGSGIGNPGVSEDIFEDIQWNRNPNDGSPAGSITNGTPHNDIFRGTKGTDSIDGSGGNDLIIGNGDKDTLNGGEGNDALANFGKENILLGGTGTDHFGVYGRATIKDIAREDYIYVNNIQVTGGIKPIGFDVPIANDFKKGHVFQVTGGDILQENGATLNVKFLWDNDAIATIENYTRPYLQQGDGHIEIYKNPRGNPTPLRDLIRAYDDMFGNTANDNVFRNVNLCLLVA